jgi:hypothetical protein
MKTDRILALCCLAILALALAFSASANELNKMTIFTFSQPIEIPGGKVLPAGAYMFRLADILGDRQRVCKSESSGYGDSKGFKTTGSVDAYGNVVECLASHEQFI